jgi:hypothetical protein
MFTGDPWREATVSANGSPTSSTASQPIAISDGYHCSDLISRFGTADSTVLAVQQQGLAYMKTWLADFKPTGQKASFRFKRGV